MNRASYPVTIYYDAACPLCAAELHAIRDHDLSERLRLIDCSAPDFHDDLAAAAGIGAAELMQAIHARDADGRWHRGVDVFVIAYDAVGLDAVARLWAHPRLRPIWDRLYPWVARHRSMLSQLRLDRPFGWLVRRAARNANRRSLRCASPIGGRCRSARRSPKPDGRLESGCRQTSPGR